MEDIELQEQSTETELSNIWKELQELDLFFDEILQLTNRIDESFENVTNIFNNIAEEAAKTVESSKNKEDQIAAGKVALGAFTIGMAVKGVGNVASSIVEHKKMNALLEEKQKIATEKLPSIERNQPRVERLVNRSKKILTKYASASWSIKDLDVAPKETFGKQKDNMLMALNMFRKALWDQYTLTYLLAEYNAWLEGKHDSKMDSPTMEDVNKAILHETLYTSNGEIKKELTDSKGNVSGRMLYLAWDNQLMGYYLGTKYNPFRLVNNNTTIRPEIEKFFATNESLALSIQMRATDDSFDDAAVKKIVVILLIGLALCYIIVHGLVAFVNIDVMWKWIIGAVGIGLVAWRCWAMILKVYEIIDVKHDYFKLYASNQLRKLAGMAPRRDKTKKPVQTSHLIGAAIGFAVGFFFFPFPGGAIVGALAGIGLAGMDMKEIESDGSEYETISIGKIWPYILALVLLLGIIGYMIFGPSLETKEKQEVVPTEEVSTSNAETEKTEEVKTADPISAPEEEVVNDESSEQSEAAPATLSFNLHGQIGDSNEAEMTIDGSTGEFSYPVGGKPVRRKLEIEEYNENSGKLIVKEYAKDNSYVGVFEGTYIDGCYKGTFTNILGVSIPFNLR